MKTKHFAGILAAVALVAPSLADAALTANLKYGSTGSDVFELQELLATEGCLSVQPTGYFGAMTLQGVKCFQGKHSLPVTGYFGVLSREKAVTIVASMTASSTQAEVEETGTTTAPVSSSTSPVLGAQDVEEQDVLATVAITKVVRSGNEVYRIAPNLGDADKAEVTLHAKAKNVSNDSTSTFTRAGWNRVNKPTSAIYTDPDKFTYSVGLEYKGVTYTVTSFDKKGNFMGEVTGTIQ